MRCVTALLSVFEINAMIEEERRQKILSQTLRRVLQIAMVVPQKEQ